MAETITTGSLESRLAAMTLAPWIIRGTALSGQSRRIGGNQFRHQFDVLGILIDHKKLDSVLLKAALIHDLLEDVPHFPGASRREIEALDAEGALVYQLVLEVTRRRTGDQWEPKSEFLLRVMSQSSHNAKLLKLADRISNLIQVGFGQSPASVMQLVNETRACILPYALGIDPDMHRELLDLVEAREQSVRALGSPA